MKKKKLLIVIYSFCCVILMAISFIAGTLFGNEITERKASIDISRLSKVLNAIDEYYQENKEYPTKPNFYENSSNCDLALEYVNNEMVSLYCGVGGSYCYHIKFAEDGNVIISRE